MQLKIANKVPIFQAGLLPGTPHLTTSQMQHRILFSFVSLHRVKLFDVFVLNVKKQLKLKNQS